MADGWWNNSGAISGCIAAYQPISAASLAASYTNLANPGTYDAFAGTAPAWWVDSGWTFTVSGSTFLRTGIVPANGYSMLVRFSNADPSGATNYWMIGVDNASNARFYLSPCYSSTQRLHASGNLLISSGIYTSGVMAIAGQKTYYNGGADTADLGAWTTTQSREIKIGCLNTTTGGELYFWKGKIQAVSVYSAALTAAEVSTVTGAMLALSYDYPRSGAAVGRGISPSGGLL